MPKDSRQVRRTKQALRDALVELIDERGFDTVTVTDITERADVGRATFYLHFDDKTSLLNSITDVVYEQLAELARAAPPASTALPSIEALLIQVREKPRLYGVVLSQTGVVEHLRAYLTKELAKRLQDLGTTESSAAAHIAAGALESLLRWWLSNNLEQSPAEVADVYRRFLIHGIPGAIGAGQTSS